MIDSVMVSRKIIADKVVTLVCYSLTPGVKIEDKFLQI